MKWNPAVSKLNTQQFNLINNFKFEKIETSYHFYQIRDSKIRETYKLNELNQKTFKQKI